MRMGSCIYHCHLVDRLFQTAAVTKRMPKPAEVLMSIDGSPVMSSNASNTIVLPIDNSQVCESMPLIIVPM